MLPGFVVHEKRSSSSRGKWLLRGWLPSIMHYPPFPFHLDRSLLPWPAFDTVVGASSSFSSSPITAACAIPRIACPLAHLEQAGRGNDAALRTAAMRLAMRVSYGTRIAHPLSPHHTQSLPHRTDPAAHLRFYVRRRGGAPMMHKQLHVRGVLYGTRGGGPM